MMESKGLEHDLILPVAGIARHPVGAFWTRPRKSQIDLLRSVTIQALNLTCSSIKNILILTDVYPEI